MREAEAEAEAVRAAAREQAASEAEGILQEASEEAERLRAEAARLCAEAAERIRALDRLAEMDGQEYPAQAQMRLLLLRFDRLRVSAAVQKLPDEAQKQTADGAEDARRSYCHQVAKALEVQRATAAAESLSGKAKANELNRS